MNNENKHERFKRLAEYRTNEVLKKLDILGNCSNKSAYDYTEQDISRIFSAIDSKAKETKARFKISKKNKFKL